MVDLKNKIAILGLGYIGLPFTVALANVGFKLIGVDRDTERIDILNRGDVPFYEPGLKETLEKNKDKITFTTNSSFAIQNADTIFVTVGTPVNKDGTPDYSQIDSAMELIGMNLKKGQLIIIKPTVFVGTTEDHIVPRLESLSGMKAGVDFYLSFCPERTIEGLALHEIYTLPKIIGGINEESSLRTAKIMEKLGGGIRIVSSPKVAEMCKLVDNLYRANNIAFANEIGLVCEKIGISSSEVVSAVNNSYSRTKIFSPGLGADGPCLSKDPYIFRHAALKHGVKTHVIDGSIQQNKESTMRIADMVKEHILKNNFDKRNLAIIGLAFKGFPETDDLRGSPAQKILDSLREEGIHFDSIKLYDPLVKNFSNHQISNSITDALQDSNIILFLTNHPKIMNLDIKDIHDKIRKPSFVIDAWGNLKMDSVPEGIKYFRIGEGKV